MSDPRTTYLVHERLRRDQAEANLRAEVSRLRAEGVPWQTIADALGVSRQSAWEKYR
jgi:hypothetical protein